MKEIVAGTGMSKGAFYHYFSSKEQVFEEVIRFFYGGIMAVDYSSFPKDSLRDFYHAYLHHMDRQMREEKFLTDKNGNSEFNMNYYLLIFDAINIFPGFRAEHLERQKAELRAWTEMVKIAKKKQEITSTLSDNIIARLFIYSGDGIGINYIVSDSVEKIRKELLALWDALYLTLKG